MCASSQALALCLGLGWSFFNYDPKSYCSYPLNTIVILNVKKYTHQMILEL